MAGRPKTPSNILKLRGAFKHDPRRENKKEPKPNSAIDAVPPESFTKDERIFFHDIIKRAPAGILGDADYHTVCVVAALLAEFYACPVKMPTARLTRLSSELGKIGFTPSGRAGLTVEKPKENKFK